MKNKKYPYYPVQNFVNLKDFIDYCGTKYADKVAFHWLKKKEEIKKSYKEFREDVEALGTYFISKGYNRTHIAVIGENSYEWLVTYFAVVNSNNIIVPLDKEASVDDLKYLVEKSDTAVLVHSADYLEEAETSGCSDLINMKNLHEIIDEGKMLIANGDSSYKDTKIDENAMCTLVYTSGTTSEPKGVMLSHKNIASDAMYTQMNSTVPDASILVLPLHHTYAIILGISVPMLVGSSIFLNKSMKNLMTDIAFCRPKYIAVVPLMMDTFYKRIIQKLRDTNKEDIISKLVVVSNALRKVGFDLRRKFFVKILEAFGGRLELIAVGGAPINEQVVVALTNFGIQVLGGYGTSECSPIVSSVRNKHYKPDSSGSIIPNVEVRTVDGELQVKGDIVFLGYYKNPQATEESFDGEWYKTGDLGEVIDGFLYISGRYKNLIVLSNGENISPESMEMLLVNNIPEIEEIVVYSQGDTIIAEVYQSQRDAEIEKIICEGVERINATLPAYKQISKTIFRDVAFEKTTTKKIKRNDLGGCKNA